MKLKVVLFFAVVLNTCFIYGQADFYSMQPLGHKYIYNSDYFDDPREIQVYQSGVDGSLRSDSLFTIYVMDAQYPPTFNLFCSTFEILYPDVPCIIVGIYNFDRQSELTPPYTDSLEVKAYDNPGHAKEMLLSLEKEIIPFIHEKYRTNNKQILVGHSLGGTFVTYAMTENPQKFPCIIAVSSNYGYDNDMLIKRLEELKPGDVADKLHIYLANGFKDRMEELFKPGISKAYSILKDKGIKVQYDSLNVYKHSHTIFEGYYRGLMSTASFIRE